ncbi:MAG: hypothetical protein QXG03_12365 [Halalkalicoccus sp.]
MSRQTIAGTATRSAGPSSDRALDPPRIGGDVAIDLRAGERFDREERRCEYVCESGERFGGRWRGVPIAELLDDGEFDPDATHLLVEAVDGFRVCVPVGRALDGILATERLDGPDDLPRLIAPSIDASRTIRRVARIEGRQLASGTDREELERLDPTAEVIADD